VARFLPPKALRVDARPSATPCSPVPATRYLLLTLATTYQYAGIRWIVAPTVTATPEEVIDAATG
jgi:hypothetical protein